MGEEKTEEQKEESVLVKEIEEKQQKQNNKDLIERDLMSFLRLSRKHGVRKEIKATKAEIKKLEEEMKEHDTRVRVDQNL